MTSDEHVDAGTPAAPVTVTPIAWLVPTATVLAIVSLAFKWFEPAASGRGRHAIYAFMHAWDIGVIFAVPPVGLVIAAVVAVALLLGRPFGRFRGLAEPGRPAGWFTVVVGVLALVCVGIEWLLVPSRVPAWDFVEASLARSGIELTRGPQFGYFLNAAAALLALLAGVAMVLTSRPAPAGED